MSYIKCDNCGSTHVKRADTYVYTSNPPQYKYKCTECGAVFWSQVCRLQDYLEDFKVPMPMETDVIPGVPYIDA